MDSDKFEYLETQGFDAERFAFLAEKKDPTVQMEIAVQWIQKHIVKGFDTGVLAIPPPVLSRAFQELSRGAVNFNQLRNFTEIPFPFPYAQLLSVMLVLFSFFTPVLAGVCIK